MPAFQSPHQPAPFRAPQYLVLTVCLVVWPCAGLPSSARANEDDERFFETAVRPLLAEHCLQCHGPSDQSGDLRLDSRDALLKGGESGPVVIPGKPQHSRLIEAVRRSEDLQMPPEAALTPQQIKVLEHWVRIGAPWPKSSGAILDPTEDASKNHWAFQPLRQVQPPSMDSTWVRTPIDAFILNRLQNQGLAPSKPAAPRILARRLAMTLTGLPPTDQAVTNVPPKPGATTWNHYVNRLLDSPAYGEHWGRHWLDIARYSDTKGYVYAREDRKWVHAWSYRDWVVDALNLDMAYDRFLLLQLAADQVDDRNPDDLAAMGFLTIGRRFLGVTRDIIDDRIDTITRGTMGLTVACARCHDHKYDPIPITDYYALYGVLNSCEQKRIELPTETTATEDWQQELRKRQQEFQTRYNNERLIASNRVRDKLSDYLTIQTKLNSVPAQGFDQVLLPDDVLPEFARRWDRYIRASIRRNDPVFQHWKAFAGLAPEDYAGRTDRILADLNQRSDQQVNARLAAAFMQAPPATFDDVVNRYTTVLVAVRDEWQQLVEDAQAADRELPIAFSDPATEELRQVLYGDDSPCEVPNESLVHTEYLFTTNTCTELWKLQRRIDEWQYTAPHQPRYALALFDRSIPSDPRVFRRGNPKTPGNDVPRAFLSALADDNSTAFQNGSGRLELAREIIARDNPLTARVIVNRVWAWHFGKGLVTTPSDFGTRAAPPTHPDLLDWLTKDFLDHGWSLKHLHRRILLSATYQQSSAMPTDGKLLEQIRQTDPSNSLLWRMPLHRLTFEEFRDSILAISGELDTRQGGQPEPLFGSDPSRRRTLYGEVDRQFFPTVLRVFDVANPDIHIPQRSETTVPQQALFYLNHPLVQDRARRLAADTETADSTEERIHSLFQKIHQRPPTAEEVQDATQLIAQADATSSARSTQHLAWSYHYGTVDEQQGRAVDLTEIPHFTGSAWQGGTNWPDKDLGWVQLTATGGHPGNDRQHACIRRWTAPRDMTVNVVSKLTHDAKPGDGIRAFVLGSRTGQLAAGKVHQQSVDFNLNDLSVAAGDTIDFAVDIGDVLNSDQFLWDITIQDSSSAAASGTWNSQTDFTSNATSPLSPWEQLVQILLCSNEFLFVD